MQTEHEVVSPGLVFPTNFCCNCGAMDCTVENQDTRVTRYFGIYGTETTFHLALPVCATCRRTLRRRPAGFFSRLLVFMLMVAGWLLVGWLLQRSVTLPLWMVEYRFTIGLVLGFITTGIFYYLRRARPPRTSFYQPVRIKQASVQFSEVMSGPGQVGYLKLAFTNPDYLHAFTHANEDAIRARRVAVARA